MVAARRRDLYAIAEPPDAGHQRVEGREEENDPEERFLDATLGGKTPNRSRTGGEDDEAGHEPQRPGGEGVAEIDQDKLDEARQVEGEIRLGCGALR